MRIIPPGTSSLRTALISASLGGDVKVSGGTVTVRNGTGAPTAIGAGPRMDEIAATFGSLAITGKGTVVIPDGSTLVVPEGVTVTVVGHLRGDGQVTNNGAIELPTDNVDWKPEALDVKPNNFLVTFTTEEELPPFATEEPETTQVRVFAISFTTGARDVPGYPTRPRYKCTGWIGRESRTEFTETTTSRTDTVVLALWAELPATSTSVRVTPQAPVWGEQVTVTGTVAPVDPQPVAPTG